jgi:hypothetical protein
VGVSAAGSILKRLGIAFLSPQLVDLLRWGRSLSTARAAQRLGFRARRDTAEALADYVKERRVIRFRPDRNAYLYEKELEEFIHSRARHVQSKVQPVPEPASTRFRPR